MMLTDESSLRMMKHVTECRHGWAKNPSFLDSCPVQSHETAYRMMPKEDRWCLNALTHNEFRDQLRRQDPQDLMSILLKHPRHARQARQAREATEARETREAADVPVLDVIGTIMTYLHEGWHCKR